MSPYYQARMRAAESTHRLEPLRLRLQERDLDAIVVSAPANVRYLSGFSGSLGFLVVTAASAEILGDSRYWIQMAEEAPAYTLVRAGQSTRLFDLVPERLRALGARRVGFEAQHLTVAAYDRLHLGVGDGIDLRPTSGLIEELRMRKSPDEVELLRAAADISSRAFDRVLKAIRPGLRERDVAFLLEQTFRELGADGPAFDTIVAAGERAALPHAHPTDRTIVQGDMVVIDFGASAAGYCADITRTVVVGSASPDQRRALETVRAAQQQSVQAMKPGVACAEIDRIARDAVTAAAGAEAAFGHGLGHGVGLEVHERPGLSASDDTVLQPGMVITNEPGVYIAGWGGVRLEDMVLITAQGNEVISSASRMAEIGS